MLFQMPDKILITKFEFPSNCLVILQTNANISDAITIDWVSLLSRARKQRAATDKRLYEERRQAFLENDNPEQSDDMDERSQ